MVDVSKKPVVEIAHSGYQPSMADLEADLRVESTFDEAVEALTKTVKIRRVIRPERDT